MKYLLLLSVPLPLKVISHGVQRPEDGVHAILAGMANCEDTWQQNKEEEEGASVEGV